MKTKNTLIKKNSPTGLFLFGLLISILITGCTRHTPSPITWHQHYVAIETNHTDQFIRNNLADAISTFGQPIIPIKEHHIRHSVKRQNYDNLRQADIQNWQLVATMILTSTNRLKRTDTKHLFTEEHTKQLLDISRGVTPSFTARQNIVNILNSQTNEPLFSVNISPIPNRTRVREEIELCEILNKQDGIFIIYLSVPESDPAFYAQLSHETFHMLNPYIFDWYMEGLCNVFAEEMATKYNFPWQKMNHHLESKRYIDPYSISFFMMKELKQLCNKDFYTILQFVIRSDTTKMSIDINAWLRSLPIEKRVQAIQIIEKNTQNLQKHQGEINSFMPVNLSSNATSLKN